MVNHVSHSLSGAVRTFTYFMASGTHYMLEGIDYLSLYGEEPSAIELCYAIFMNVIELDKDGYVINFEYAQKRATDSIREFCDPSFKVVKPWQDGEQDLY